MISNLERPVSTEKAKSKSNRLLVFRKSRLCFILSHTVDLGWLSALLPLHVLLPPCPAQRHREVFFFQPWGLSILWCSWIDPNQEFKPNLVVLSTEFGIIKVLYTHHCNFENYPIMPPCFSSFFLFFIYLYLLLLLFLPFFENKELIFNPSQRF